MGDSDFSGNAARLTGLPACAFGWVLHPSPEISQLTLAELTDVPSTPTPPER